MKKIGNDFGRFEFNFDGENLNLKSINGLDEFLKVDSEVIERWEEKYQGISEALDEEDYVDKKVEAILEEAKTYSGDYGQSLILKATDLLDKKSKGIKPSIESSYFSESEKETYHAFKIWLQLKKWFLDDSLPIVKAVIEKKPEVFGLSLVKHPNISIEAISDETGISYAVVQRVVKKTTLLIGDKEYMLKSAFEESSSLAYIESLILETDEEEFKQYQLNLCEMAGKKPSFKTRFKAGEGRWFQYLSYKYNINVKSRTVGSALANVKHELI